MISALGKHWNPMGATMMAALNKPVEGGAAGTRVRAADGAEAIDLAGSFGVFLVGHANPRVVAAVEDALDTAPVLIPGIEHPVATRLRAVLTEITPPGLDTFVFGCSGTEATETALRAVWWARPGRRRIVVADGGFQGKSLAATGILGQAGARRPFEPFEAALTTVPYGDARALRAALAPGDVAAVFLEPVLGGADLSVPPRGYFAEAAAACADTGTLLVADEIQCGFGRTGRMFAVEHDGVVPDIMLLSKALSGGVMPISVCAIGTEVLDDAARHPMWSAEALGGGSCRSALSLAAAVAAIEEIRSADLPGRATALGHRLLAGLRAAVREHPKHLVTADGIGLMTGLRVRSPGVEALLVGGMAARGVHVGLSLNERLAHPVVRFYPPLVATDEEIDRVLAALDEVLRWLDQQPRRTPWLLTRYLRTQFRLPPRLILKIAKSPLTVDW